jgi:hypothetical protein
MSTKKQLIEESFNKMKSLLESDVIKEQPATPSPAPATAAATTQSANQQQPASDPNRDAKIAKNIDVTMDQAMASVVKNLPQMLANFAKSTGDKDGALDAPGVYDNNAKGQQAPQQAQQTQNQSQAKPIQEGGIMKELTFDEAKFMECMGEGELQEGGLIGLAASAPAILKYGGQATKWIGKKMDSAWLQKWGNKTAEAGEKLHHKYIHVIEKALKPLMPNATPEQIHKAANGVFMGAVGVLFAGSLAHPGFLTGVKGAELGQEALAALQKSLPTLGFA